MNEFLKTAPEITAWLDAMDVRDYALKKDNTYGFVVDVEHDVDLRGKNLIEIPVKFNAVGGYFWCSYNKLTSLEFCPVTVGFDFVADHNCLQNLKGCPQIVGGHFYIDQNSLTSLEGSPRVVNKDFFCSHNLLTSLEFCPEKVGRNFHCYHNQLTSLEYCPESMGGSFYCHDNALLGNVQQIDDFTEILRVSQNLRIEKEKAVLSHVIAPAKKLFHPSISHKI